MKTLLIDDEPFEVKLLARQLQLLGCADVVSCDGAEPAMAALQADAESFGLVFCDLQMPGVDGVQFMRHLAQTGYQGSLVLVSGEDGRILQAAQKLAQAHQIHVLAALAKPVSLEQLQKVLAAAESRKATVAKRKARAFSPKELKQAIDGGELVNHYQPKIDMASARPVGAEALVRWQHPTAGLVFPDEFVPLAEKCGLIDDLTRAVLAMALRQARAWRNAGHDLQIAVNVSMDNLAALEFPEVVVSMLDEAGVAPSALVLEVTESRLMKDVRASLDILARLRLKHIGLAIDDFGTGHSSLLQLRDIPFDELKMDRGFVNGAAEEPALRAIVEGTLAIARQLGLKTVAEGVETRADWDMLRELGCNVVQGYFVAKPMPGLDIPAWTLAWNARREQLSALAI